MGIGRASPSYALDVLAGQAVGRFTSTHNVGGGSVIERKNTTISSITRGAINFDDRTNVNLGQIAYYASGAMAFRVGGSEQMRMDSSGRIRVSRIPTANALEVDGNASKTTAGSLLANSDARIKTDVATSTNDMDTLARVYLVSFRYTDDYRAAHPKVADRAYHKVVAQEFQEVFPDYVQRSGEKPAVGDEEILKVDTYPLTIYSVAAVQELSEKLETQLKAKDAELQALKQRLEAIERRLSKQDSASSISPFYRGETKQQRQKRRS